MYENLLWKINPTLTDKNNIYRKIFKFSSQRNISYYYHESWMSEAILIISHLYKAISFA